MEAAITVLFSVCPLAVTRAGNSSLYSFSTVLVQTIGLRSFTETADCLDDFETIFPVLRIFQTRNPAIVLCWSPSAFIIQVLIMCSIWSFTCGSYRNLLCKPLLAFYLVAFRTYTISILVTSTVLLCTWTRWRQSISNFTIDYRKSKGS